MVRYLTTSLHSFCNIPPNQEFGIDIIGEDNKTTIHHKVAARVMCVFTEEDAQLAARLEQMQNSTGHPGLSPQQGGSGSGSQFSFAPQGQPGPPTTQRRPGLQSQSVGNMGSMGANMRPPGKSGLSFDHILSRLQGELQKSRDTSTDLQNLSNSMNDLQDILGGTLVRYSGDINRSG